jgi:hypothetical protein
MTSRHSPKLMAPFVAINVSALMTATERGKAVSRYLSEVEPQPLLRISLLQVYSHGVADDCIVRCAPVQA